MMEQDKNFNMRLKAIIERKLKEHGIITYGPLPPRADEKPSKAWSFIESLDEITLQYLQTGQK